MRTSILTLAGAAFLYPGPHAAQAEDKPASAANAYGALTARELRADAAKASEPAAVATPLNGATAINETYGDWTTACRVVESATRCVISQAQGHRQSGEQVFAIQLQAPRNGIAEGTIIMPFGLELDAGAVLKLDGKDLGQGLKFSTCVPQGCLLPVSLPSAAIEAAGKASVFTVSSLELKRGTPVTFTVSTNGFKAALERAARLAS